MATDGTPHVATAMDAADVKSELLGLYRNVEFLTSGGFGSIYTAADQDDTVKILKVTQVCALTEAHALTEEFNLMARLNHPNIAQVYNNFCVNQVLGFEMKIYPGGDLHDAIQQRIFTPLQTLALACEILAGLAFIHWFRLVHRDIKPGNILLDSGYRGVISDFGLAIASDKIVFGEIHGTDGYIAPEVLNRMKYDTRADIWSFTRIVYAIISREPFDPVRLHYDMVPICLRELVNNADYENPTHRKPARWYTLAMIAADLVDLTKVSFRYKVCEDSDQSMCLSKTSQMLPTLSSGSEGLTDPISAGELEDSTLTCTYE